MTWLRDLITVLLHNACFAARTRDPSFASLTKAVYNLWHPCIKRASCTWLEKHDQHGDSFGHFLWKKIAQRNLIMKTFKVRNKPCRCRVRLHFSLMMVHFYSVSGVSRGIVLYQMPLICNTVSLKTRTNSSAATRMHCTASYIGSEREA